MSELRAGIKRQVDAALKIAEGRDPQLALQILDNLPEGAVNAKKMTELVEYISQFISSGPGAGGGTGSG